MNLIKKIEDFIENNIELINEYESINYNINIDTIINDTADLLEKYIRMTKSTDINSIIKYAFNIAIKKKISLIEAFEYMINTKIDIIESSNSIQQYFKEINNIYLKNKNDYNIEYCNDNREKLIQMNLKSVISIAKKYQGLGLTLNELISAGNLGLVTAFDKFNPYKNKLKDSILSCVQNLPENFSGKLLEDSIKEYLKYGEIKKKFIPLLKKNNINKKELIKWVDNNIKNAKFNSIAVMWIKAYILIEIDNYSRLVKKPKSEIYKDKEEFGTYKKEITLDIDAPITDETKTCIHDILKIEDDEISELESHEAYCLFKDNLYKLLDGVKLRDKNIFLKKFGIGLPRPLLPKEIAEQENLSIARVSQIFQSVTEQIQQNSKKFKIDPNILFDAVRKM